MTKTKTPDPGEVLGLLNDNQKSVLAAALYEAEDERQKRGVKTLRAAWGELPSYTHARTKAILAQRGLTDGWSWRPNLSSLGLKVARLCWPTHGTTIGYEGGDYDKPIRGTVQETVAAARKERAEHERKEAETMRHAKHLWRGLTIKEWDGRHAVSTEIEADGRLHLSFEAAVDLGQQIEKLRR